MHRDSYAAFVLLAVKNLHAQGFFHPEKCFTAQEPVSVHYPDSHGIAADEVNDQPRDLTDIVSGELTVPRQPEDLPAEMRALLWLFHFAILSDKRPNIYSDATGDVVERYQYALDLVEQLVALSIVGITPLDVG